MSKFFKTIFTIAAFLVLLMSCGGGGGADTTTPLPPVDTALGWDEDNWDKKDWE